jgi:hypothetical protein
VLVEVVVLVVVVQDGSCVCVPITHDVNVHSPSVAPQ